MAEELGAFLGRLGNRWQPEEMERRGMEFLRSRKNEWAAEARALVLEAGVRMEPVNVEPAVWAAWVERFADSTAALVAGEAILVRAVAPVSEELFPDLNVDGVTRDQVRAWVEAGLDGDELGKEIDERDTGDADSITEGFLRAVEAGAVGDGSVHWASLQEFIAKRGVPPTGSVLQEVLREWCDGLLPRIYRAWGDWCSSALW